MFLVGLISWWYGRGWTTQWQRVGGQLMRTLAFFSVGELLSTLFAPFRQISAGTRGDGTFGSALRAFADQLVSRIIGAIVRFFTVLVALVVIALQSVYSLVIMIIWWVVPLLPVFGFILLAIGWVPAWH